MRVTALFIYPIKACRGLEVSLAEVTARGFDGDRRWMVIDQSGRFLTQREHPRLALARCAFAGDDIELTGPQLPELAIPRVLRDGARIEVTIWSGRCAALVHPDASAWFSRLLGRDCRAVYMPDDVRRPIADGDGPEPVSFADAYPYLLTTEASLAELDRRLPAPISMRRFRPNIVIDGDAAFAEDGWRQLHIGTVPFRVVKGCDRCAVTTVDPETGEKGTEPLRTLATFRKRDGKVWFGVNMIATGVGELGVGDPVQIV